MKRANSQKQINQRAKRRKSWIPVDSGGEGHQERIGDLSLKLWKMRIDGTFCDAQIVVKGKHIDCHRNILAASTEYFEKMFEYTFSENKDSISKIILDKDEDDGFSPKVVETVLHYIYFGCMPVKTDLKIIPDVFMLSHMWLLTDIQDICTNIMVKNIATQNFKEFLDFATKFNIVNLEGAVIDFIRRNLPHIYKMEEFPEIEEDQFYKTLEDPLILCHENCLWMEAIKHWSQESDAKLFSALDRIQMNYLSESEIDTLLGDNRVNGNKNMLKMVKAKIEEKDTHAGVKYYSKERFYGLYLGDGMIGENFSPGCLVHHNSEKIIIENVEISIDSLRKVLGHNVNQEINSASQAVFNNEIFFFFRTRCVVEHAELWNKAIFVYSLVEKNWRKIDISLSELLPGNDIGCLSCDEYDRSTAKILHVEQSILYLFISTEKQRILLCRNLNLKDAEWKLKFANEESGEDIENINIEDVIHGLEVNNDETQARPDWRTCKILKIDDEKITFFGQVSIDYEPSTVVFTLAFDNEISMVSGALGKYHKDCKLALIEKNSLEKAVVFSTNRIYAEKKTKSCLQLYNFGDNATEVDISDELTVKAASIDVINDVFYIIGKTDIMLGLCGSPQVSCMSYNLQTKVWNNLHLEDRKRFDSEMPEIMTFDLETPGFEVSYQLLYRNEDAESGDLDEDTCSNYSSDSE